MERWIAILIEVIPIGFALALAVAAAVDPVRELRDRLDVGAGQPRSAPRARVSRLAEDADQHAAGDDERGAGDETLVQRPPGARARAPRARLPERLGGDER